MPTKKLMLRGAMALVLLAGSVPAFAAPLGYEQIFTLMDNYIGANDHGGKYRGGTNDAIGGQPFDILYATATRVVDGGTTDPNLTDRVFYTDPSQITNKIQVSIYTYYNATDNPLTQFGDLFLTQKNLWDPNTSTACGTTTSIGSDPCDNLSTTGTQWKYVVTADSPSGGLNGTLVDNTAAISASGTGTIYQINPNNIISSFVPCDQNPSNWLWRDGQPVEVATSGNPGTGDCTTSGPENPTQVTAADVLSTAVNWAFTTNVDGNGLNELTYTFDASNLDGFLGATPTDGDFQFGMSWAMSCANDVIQGQVDWAPVPEPSSVVLLLAGVAGLGARRRRRKAA